MKKEYIVGEEYFTDPLLCRQIYSKYLQGHSTEDIQYWVIMQSKWKVTLSEKLIHAIIDLMNHISP